jgi:formylmethanofuran dehydrogenase subunit E
VNPNDKAYACDRCGEHTPDGEGTHYKGERYCPSCAEIELFWETIETVKDDEVTA